ncbi:MAG TPA: hypothetical protein VNO70_08390, partial [Blastocatellia bacterium]|nr:hypothetical protein [Blastocatellia bacterium]
MRRKLHWLLISRLAVAGVLLVTVGITEQGANSPRAFLPVLSGVAGVIVTLSVFYFIALRAAASLQAQGYVQLFIDLLLATWLVYRTGDVESPFLALYLVVIFAACALFDRA